MSTIARLQAKLRDIDRRSEAIRAAAEATDRSLTDAERDRLDDLADRFDTIEADIRRIETIERQRRAAAATSATEEDCEETPAPEPAAHVAGSRTEGRASDAGTNEPICASRTISAVWRM